MIRFLRVRIFSGEKTLGLRADALQSPSKAYPHSLEGGKVHVKSFSPLNSRNLFPNTPPFWGGVFVLCRILFTMPEQHSSSHYLWWLIGLLALVSIAYAVQATMQSRSSQSDALIPPPTPSDYVSEQQGFDYLVSYTEEGFAPTTVAVQTGERVRWTNNSAKTLRLALPSTEVIVLESGAYFEYTFAAEVGTVSYSDGQSARVSIVVSQ